MAEKGGFFGKHVYRSEVNGILKEINHEDGSITIEETESNEDSLYLSYFKGEIDAIEKDEIVLRVNDGKNFPLKEASGNFGGPLYILHNKAEVDIDAVNQKIILAEKLSPYQQIKLEALGAGGLISCHNLPQPTRLPTALLKLLKPDLFTVLIDQQFPYCIIDKQQSTIYFYQ